MNIIKSIAGYIKEMNSEPLESGGGVSIKRNMASLVTVSAIGIEFYSLSRIVLSDANLKHFVWLGALYVITDLLFSLLVLRITSLEKVADLVQRIKGGILSSNNQQVDEEKQVEEKHE